MDIEELKQIYIDLRQQLYPLMGQRMTKALDSFESGQWAECFQACNSIKVLISSEMNVAEKTYFEQVTLQLRNIVWSATGKDDKRDAKDKIEKNKALAKVPELLEIYMQLLFSEMSNQGIWFPKGKRHETFNDLLLDESFGLKPEPIKDKIKMLKGMTAEELLESLPRQELEKLYVKKVIQNVLQK